MLVKENIILNILENYSLWLEDQKIRRFHRKGLTEKKLKSLELDLNLQFPTDYREVLANLGVFLPFSRVDLYNERQVYQANTNKKKRCPEQLLEFACHADGGIFCFDYKELVQKSPVVVLYSYPSYEILWKPQCSFKAWYQLLQIYTFIEEKDYFQQEELNTWTDGAKKELKTLYHRLKIHPYNEKQEFMLL